jgi:hypothetical protein
MNAKLSKRFIRKLAVAHSFRRSVKLDQFDAERGFQRAVLYCAKGASKAADKRSSIDCLDLHPGQRVTCADRQTNGARLARAPQ